MPLKNFEFAFIACPVTNLERARAFYEGVLGLQVSTSTINGHDFRIEYDVGPHTLWHR